MLHIALVEDERKEAEIIVRYIKRFSEEKGELYKLTRFSDGIDFISDYKPVYDIVFMDIRMPQMNGMEAAKRLRAVDPNVCLIFITNMGQYALKGYEVDAFDFIVKPIGYSNFRAKLQRAEDASAVRKKRSVCVNTSGGVRIVFLHRVRYVEVRNNMLTYHTQDGSFELRGSLRETEELFDSANFVRCNNCYLVNLDYVTAVKGSTVFLGDDALRISRPRKKEFMSSLAAYW